MRILIINPILYTSETDNIPKKDSIKDTMIYTLCMGFLANGHEPILIAANNYRPTRQEEYPFSIVWLDTAIKKLCKPRCLPLLKGLNKYIKKNKNDFDFIITSEVFSLSTLSSVIYAKSQTIIWHELAAHNNMMKKIPSKVWYNVIARLFMREAKVIPRSRPAREFISKYCQRVSTNIIDHGVDMDKLGYEVNKEEYFVVISQLIERKGIDGIIDKFYEFLQDEPTYTLKIIGSGIQKEALEEQVKKLGIEDNVNFYGNRTHDEIAPILRKAKAMLVNTIKDCNMVSIVESISTATPVVTSKVPYTAWYVEQEKLGIADDKWGKEELKEVCENNRYYVDNCVQYREKLSNRYCAEEFIKNA